MSLEDKEQETVPIKAKISDQFLEELTDATVKKMIDLAPKDFYEMDINGSTEKFKRRKIYSKERMDLETIRQRLAAAVGKLAKDYARIEDELYKRMCQYYLIDTATNKPMTPEQFDMIAFEDIKPILDACAFRTERPLPMPINQDKINPLGG